jgi:Phosphoesterase family
MAHGLTIRGLPAAKTRPQSKADRIGLLRSSILSGTSACLDTINGAQVPYWQDTAIFVVWADWGGFYDHIQPFEVQSSQTVCPTAPWGCGYTYGFRVPLLVVSAFTPTGYVSGACGPGTSHQTCPNNNYPYQNDFGSILAFVEHNFGLTVGGINPQYRFADAFAPELQQNPSAVPLADFFTLTSPKPFGAITTPGSSFTSDYFLNYSGPTMDPDNDAIEPQN